MNPIRNLLLATALVVLIPTKSSAALIVQLERSGNDISLAFDSQAGTNYQLQVSTNLSQWDDRGAVIAGDGGSKTQLVSNLGQPQAFFRIKASQPAADLAPSVAEFTAVVVGKSVLSYSFLSATRFSWSGETGNWTYTKTGNNTARLVLTYDSDGNNPAAYREEVLMTFQTSTQGYYRYSEFYSNIEYAGSVSNGTFDLGGP
jgi:hypothetical protein